MEVQPDSRMLAKRIREKLTSRFYDLDVVKAFVEEIAEQADVDDRDAGWYALCEQLIRVWNLVVAEEVAQAIEERDIDKARLFGKIAAKYVQMGRLEKARRLLQRMIDIARSCNSEAHHAGILLDVAWHYLDEIGDRKAALALTSEAQALLEAMGDYIEVDKMRSEVSTLYALCDNWEQAKITAVSIINDYVRWIASRRLDNIRLGLSQAEAGGPPRRGAVGRKK